MKGGELPIRTRKLMGPTNPIHSSPLSRGFALRPLQTFSRQDRSRSGSHHFDRTLRQRGEERLPVSFAEDPVVEHDHDAGVALGPDETADPLAKF